MNKNESFLPKISIIVPVYKVEQYLRCCLDSIVAQTFTDWECILIDDGSPDNSGAICDEYAEKDKRFRVIHQENKGVSTARNNGLVVARSEWITFVDGDDYIDSDYLSLLYSASENVDIVLIGNNDILQNGKIIKNSLNKSDFNNLAGIIQHDYYKLKNYFGPPWGKLFSSRIIKQNKILFPYNLCASEDEFFNHTYLCHIKKYSFINECKYFYYKGSSNSLSKKRTEKSFSSELYNLDFKQKTLKNEQIKETNCIINVNVCQLLISYIFSLPKNNIIQLQKFIKKPYICGNIVYSIILLFFAHNQLLPAELYRFFQIIFYKIKGLKR